MSSAGRRGSTGRVTCSTGTAADGRFEPWPSQRVDRESTYGLALVATDCNGDARSEIYVANDSTINLLYRRDDAGMLDEWGLFSGAGYSSEGLEQAGMGATAADFDADGQFDVLVSNFQNDNNALYRNLGDCAFEEVSQLLGLAASSLRTWVGRCSSSTRTATPTPMCSSPTGTSIHSWTNSSPMRNATCCR